MVKFTNSHLSKFKEEKKLLFFMDLFLLHHINFSLKNIQNDATGV